MVVSVSEILRMAENFLTPEKENRKDEERVAVDSTSPSFYSPVKKSGYADMMFDLTDRCVIAFWTRHPKFKDRASGTPLSRTTGATLI